LRIAAAITLLTLFAWTGWADEAQPVSGEYTVDLPTINAEQLAAELASREGKIVVLNMWATWCGPCVEEFPYLVEFAHGVNPDEVAIIAISSDFPEDVETEVYPFLAEQRPPFPVFLQDEHEDIFIPAVDPEWRGAYPHTVIFDAEGNIAGRLGVFHGAEELRAAVDAASS